MKSLSLDGERLTLGQLADIAYNRSKVELSSIAKQKIDRARGVVDAWLKSGETIYGVTTGFGEFSNVSVSAEKLDELQENLILSHAVGAGELLPVEIVRAMMALRVNALAKGYSGVRLETVKTIVDMLNRNIVPMIPSQGSVGASGDLVQLAHLVLAMMGKGKVFSGAGPGNSNGSGISSRSALRANRIRPAELKAKEGLALINGTQMMTAFTALAVHRAKNLLKAADIAGALSVEALRGSDTPYDARIQNVRPHRGQKLVASNLRRMIHGSEIRESHRYNDSRVQDAYSMRCIPQVHGASRDAVGYVAGVVDVEMNSANDNPLIFARQGIHLEGGNFHGQPIALSADFLAIALSELANISERRIERLVNGSLSGLPRFLTEKGGLHSGLMIAQYTAASIVSENKVLCHPASVDSIPTSANQEDHNSMGSIGAQKAWRVLRNAETVIAIELLCGAQGLDFARTYNTDAPMKAGRGTEAAFRHIRKSIDHLDRDRVLHGEIQKMYSMVFDTTLVESVERVIGTLD